MYFLYFCLVTPGKQPYFEISEMTTHRTTHGSAYHHILQFHIREFIAHPPPPTPLSRSVTKNFLVSIQVSNLNLHHNRMYTWVIVRGVGVKILIYKYITTHIHIKKYENSFSVQYS
jgi:hypothetical protein